MKKNELLHFTVAKKMSVNCSTLLSSCHFFCHLLESGLARINWIRAVDKICVEQLICCQRCRANDCRAIAFRAVHPHSVNVLGRGKLVIGWFYICWKLLGGPIFIKYLRPYFDLPTPELVSRLRYRNIDLNLCNHSQIDGRNT